MIPHAKLIQIENFLYSYYYYYVSSFIGNFTRSGVDGQYRDELHIDTINFVKNNFSDFSLLYKL